MSLDGGGNRAVQELATAADVRRANADLDAALLHQIDQLDPARLTHPEPGAPEGGAWTAAIVLGHLGEFPHFFAGELRRWRADPSAEVGRTVEAPERLRAVAAAHQRALPELRATFASAAADLADALELLTDADVTAPTQNRKYGAEPMTAFLDRYVIGHKRGHLAQLGAMPAADIRDDEER